MDAMEKVFDQIEMQRDSIITFLMEFINHKSINPDRALPGEPGDERGCQEWLRDQMDRMSIFDQIDLWGVAPERPNLVGVLGNDKKPHNAIMFNGHVDVVPVTAQQYSSWTIGDPWKASVVNGRVYGRGAADMKGGIAAFLWAMKALAEAKIPLAGRVIAAINIGEESSNFDLGSRAIVERGYKAPLVINAEPTNLTICPATKGAFFFKITVTGKGTHVAYNNLALYPSPFGEEVVGVSAIVKARSIMDALDSLNWQWAMHNKHPLCPPGAMNHCLVSIRGGEYLGAIPDTCELIYIVWFNPDFKSETVMKEIENVLEAAVTGDYWLRSHPPKLEMPYLEADRNTYEPIDIPPSRKECILISDAYEGVMKKKPVFRCFPAVCDANEFYRLGMPSVIIGPGDLTMGTHSENEYVPIEQIIQATKIYANIAAIWLGVEQ